MLAEYQTNVCVLPSQKQTTALMLWACLSRYQPEQPNLVYQMARTTDELDQVDQNEMVSASESQTGFLPATEKFSLKTILSPKNMEPSKFSGLIVNISAGLLGKSSRFSWEGFGVCLCGAVWLLVLRDESRVGMGEVVRKMSVCLVPSCDISFSHEFPWGS